MERVRRRLWTWSVSALAILVIAGAVVSGLFQLAVLAMPTYRDDLSAWVTRVAERPVQIGGVNLVWRGLYPRLDLSDITLFDQYSAEAELSVQRLSLGFALPRLAMGDFFPTRIELSGLSVAVNVDAEGHIEVAGFDPMHADRKRVRDDRWFGELSRFQRVRLENCEVRWTQAGLDEPLLYTLETADIDRTARGFDMDGSLRLPRSHGGRVEFEADVAGEVSKPRSWTGSFSASTEGLKPQAWIGRWLAADALAAASGLDLSLEGSLQTGRLALLDVRAEAAQLAVVRGGRAHAARDLRAHARLTPEGAGWRLDIPEVQLSGQPQLAANLRWLTLPDGGYELDADADRIDLGLVAPWLAYLREPGPLLRVAARARGQVQGLVLRRRWEAQQMRYSLRAELSGVALAADENLGFSGVSGRLTASEAGGRLQLSGKPVQVEAPRAVPAALAMEQLSGSLEWRRAAAGWQLSMDDLGWQLAGSEGNGRFGLLLPDDRERSPELDLSAQFSAQDATRFKPYMPQHWGADLKKWLNGAIQRGRVRRGTLVIRGPLADFPFHKRRTGEWQLDLDVANARLAFLPEWPAADNLDARLQFRGNSLNIEAESGTLAGVAVEKAVARFDDFSDAVLTIDGLTQGEIARFYAFVRASPLKKVLAGLIDNTSASGQATVGVHLEIPIRDAQNTRVGGTVTLNAVELFYRGLEQPISDIEGELFFTDKGVRADKLAARFEELQLDARIEPREDSAGMVVADFSFAPRADGTGASQYVPQIALAALAGQSRWRAALPLGRDTALALTSDLVGTSVALPRPLLKDAAQAAPMRITIGSDRDAPVRVSVDYRERLAADIVLASEPAAGGEEAGMRARAVSLHLGAGAAEPAQGEGLALTGRLAELDAADWGAALKGAEIKGLPLRRAELDVEKLRLAGQTFGPTRIAYSPGAAGVARVLLSGSGIAGTLDWNEGTRQLNARLSHAAIDSPPPASDVDDATEAPPSEFVDEGPATDPAALPALDVVVEQLRVGGVDLGKLRMITARISGGQRIETLTLTGGKLGVVMGGQWRRAEERSAADLSFELESTDIASVLRGLGYAANLDARQSRFTGALSWASSQHGLRWEQAQGNIGVEVSNGVLKAVDPGAGRVLGLINFYALPRRLTLDFRDVVQQGLAFDRINGRFELGGGAALTDNLDIDGPSLRMEVRGRIGLVARDYDQRVTVYPDISAGVTLGAALLAGPAVGALVLLAQEVLDKPLDQVTQLSYRLTGTWDNPKIERLGGVQGRAGSPRG